MKFCALLLLCVCPLAAANDWIRVTSANFELYTNAGAKDARKTIEYFEQVRDFFMRTKSAQVTTRLPVTIVGFRGPKDYKPYAVNESAAAYYLGDENRDYIVMGSIGEEDFPVATHEYMHLLIRHSDLKLPIWLNEGIAEVYSSLKQAGRKIMIGNVLPGRAQLLGMEKWIPLETLFRIRHDSPEYNEKNRTGILYSQSWLLAHMLMLSPGYAPNFAKFLEVIHSTESSQQAFETAYGKQIVDVWNDLQAYYRSNGVRVGIFDVKFEKLDSVEPQPATDAQVGVVLAKLTAMLRRYDEAESRLKALIATNPDSPEIHEALGHLYWMKRDTALARQHLGRAVELKSTVWKTYWDFARLAYDAPPEDKQVTMALESAIEMNPALTEARIMLGHRLYRANRPAQALITLNQTKQVTPEMAPRLFLLIAHASLRLKDNEGAKKALFQAKKYAKEPADIQQVEQMLAFIDRPVTMASVRPAIEPVTEETTASNNGDRPRLQRRSGATTTWDVPPSEPSEKLASLRGVLTAIECSGEQAKLRVAVGNTSLAFLIKDPGRVYIKGAGENQQVLTCGPTRKPIALHYLPADDRGTGTVGEAREIDFGGSN